MSGIKWLSGNLAELDGVKFKWEAGIAYCDYGEDGVFENEGCGTITYEEWVKMINDDAKSTHEHCPSYPNCNLICKDATIDPMLIANMWGINEIKRAS